MKNVLHDVLKKYDTTEKEYQPFHVICKEIKDLTLGEKSTEVDAEIMALTFGENEGGETGPWGTFFRPNMRYHGPKGVFENPNYENITEEIIDYWKQRAENVENLYLKARYLGLFYEFNSKVTGRPFDIKLTILYIRTIILLCEENNNLEENDLIRMILRALNIVLKIKNNELEKSTIEAVIALEDKISKDLELITWGFCFENLVLKNKKKLTDNQLNKLIDDMEKRIIRLAIYKEPYLIEHAVEMLSQYFRSNKNQNKVEEIVQKLAEVMKIKALKSSPVLAFDLYMNLHKLYKKNNMKNEMDEATRLITEIGPKVLASMQPMSVKTRIENDQIDIYLSNIVSGGFEKGLNRIIVEFLPKISEIQSGIKGRINQAPIFSLLTTQRLFQSGNGRLIATIESGQSENNLAFHYIQNIQVHNFFLEKSIDKLFEQYQITDDYLLDYIYQSPIFEKNVMQIIKKGLTAYFDNDFIVSMHLLIPQLEAAFRNLIRAQEATVMNANKIGGMNYSTFDSVLTNEKLKTVFDEDSIFYFRSILTDQTGLNLRNDVCHGLKGSNEFNKSSAVRVLHILLYLSQVRLKTIGE
ncbi:DUF4209 domain-containing protein [Acinetobacter lwoffii]|uniref:DUF4209 domain-containing protein n=1 Tax=Acinetobacter lwoffii TaxID=28090 RepID=UPI00300A9D3B